MGIKLGKIIPRKTISFEDLRGKKIGVDFSNVAFQFLSSIRQRDGTPLMDSKGDVTSHLMGILTRSLNLMQQGLKLCYIFDGKPPDLKYEEKLKRELRKQQAEEKYEHAVQEEDLKSMIKYAKQTSRLNKQMVEESKELIEALGMPVIQSPSESDAQGSYMTKKGDIWAFSSSDHDCLIFECPRILPNLTLSQKRKIPGGKYIYTKPELIELKTVLSELKLNQDQLITLAILIGTDYNRQGIPGIGPKKALKLIHEHKTSDKIFALLKPNFDWEKIYKIFTNMKVKKDYKLEWSNINNDRVLKLLVDNHEFSHERVESMLSKLNKTPKDNASLSNWIKK